MLNREDLKIASRCQRFHAIFFTRTRTPSRKSTQNCTSREHFPKSCCRANKNNAPLPVYARALPSENVLNLHRWFPRQLEQKSKNPAPFPPLKATWKNTQIIKENKWKFSPTCSQHTTPLYFFSARQANPLKGSLLSLSIMSKQHEIPGKIRILKLWPHWILVVLVGQTQRESTHRNTPTEMFILFAEPFSKSLSFRRPGYGRHGPSPCGRGWVGVLRRGTWTRPGRKQSAKLFKAI